MTDHALQDPFGLTGSLLEGQYRVDAVIGEGGFGVVYRGQHLSLDQPIAVKMLKGLDGGDAVNALVLEKFRMEARLLYTLSQSSLHIVRALDFGATTTPSGIWAPFMILEWLEGRSLAEDLEERRRRGMRGRSVEEALAILGPVADGLRVAHARQVAHRDVKPANVFLLGAGATGGPQVKVLDFGIAKIMKEGEAVGTKGTFASFTWLYATPEQLDARVGLTGMATDVYAFALVLTELLTDRKPIDDRDVIAIMKTALDPSRRPTPRTRGANVPDEIEAVCLRALAVDPRDRFPTIAEFWAALAAARDSRHSTRTQAHMAPLSIGAAPPSPRGTHTADMPLSVGVPPPSPRVPPSTLGATDTSPLGIPARATAVPISAPLGGPPPGTRPPGNVPPLAMGPPPGTRPPGVIPTPIFGASPPPWTPPPGRPIGARPEGPNALVIMAIAFGVLAVLFFGTCGALYGACL